MAALLDDRSRPRAVAALFALLGAVVVSGSIVLMNSSAASFRTQPDSFATAVQIEQRARPPQQEQPKPKPKPRRQPRARLDPSVALAGSLAGMDFGLPQFDGQDLADAASILGEGSGTMTDDTVDVPPRPIAQGPMPYPPRAKAQGITGYVLLSVLVGPTGQVERVKVLESNPSGIFDDTAVAGVQSWRFEPASYQGESVRVWVTQRVRFDLG